MADSSRPNDRSGRAYGRRAQHPDKLLTEVGPGTPLGELMRRYWHPIAVSVEVKDLPKKVRILGEDLILFRDHSGRPGLLYPRCMHRGTSLFYGRTEERGIRCCYHGWLFDVEGRCLDQPCEPDAGRHRAAARQPWYPVEERYGLVFAYLGPADKEPILPRFDNLESIREDEVLMSRVVSFGATATTPYSWLHQNDNVMDPFHVYILHSTFSGPQFAPQFALMPKVDFFSTECGVCYTALRQLDDGQEVDRISSWIIPNIMSVPDVQLKPGPSSGISWVVPVDDDHYVQVMATRIPKRVLEQRSSFRGFLFNGKTWGEMSEEDHQRTPGDYEAQAGQGPISLHSEEHLVTSDRGIMMQRCMLKEQIEAVARGQDPIGVAFDASDALVKVRSGVSITRFERPANAAPRAQIAAPW